MTEYPHLLPAYRQHADMGIEERVAWIRADRWLETADARAALARAPPPKRAASVVNLRAETEYRQLARGIIQSEGWKSLPSKAGRARNRAIGKLMLRALNDE